MKYLPHRDLCNFALTNRKMRVFALNPNLFADFGERKDCLEAKIMAKGMTQFLAVERFKKIRSLTFRSTEKNLPAAACKILLQHIVSNSLPGLKALDLDLGGANWKKMNGQLLGRALVKLEGVTLADSTNPQQSTFLEKKCSTSRVFWLH